MYAARREHVHAVYDPADPYPHLITGDLEHAVTLIGSALPTVTPGNPGRLGRKLDDWSREATAFASVPAVRAARRQVAELVGAQPGV